MTKLGSPRLQKLHDIVDNSQAGKIDGVMVDVISARAILTCWLAGNATTRRVIEGGDIVQVSAMAWKVAVK